MRSIDLSSVSWRKSSYSNTDGGQCLEVSDDLLSTAAWRKSSYSNNDGGECLEVSDSFPSLVPVRDSKDPSAGSLLFAADSWAAFLLGIKS
ncbi:DUF397 domain-containing protein [Streptomyces niveiscabiei]|uniref:DUF397 domain-containing protein n=1 Tax=Streptomyces niveiscabiei TaxID=164115 RepID=A0ABW9HVI6_9ACTN|nr:DUF397 domain-containing protein [Streptomyces niveiscabiei]MDX3382834.1 DUF397 domain-containing protein [Streptomyces niveiscabiei]